MKKLYELVKVIDVEPLEFENCENFNFRLEIFSEMGGGDNFFGKVYRLETCRLRPTFPVNKEDPGFENDAGLFILDEAIDSERLRGNSVEEVIDKFKKTLAVIFGEYF